MGFDWTVLVVARSNKMTFSSIGFPVNPYPRNKSGYWLFTSDEPCFAVIKIVMEEVALGAMDHLKFYDGPSTDARVLKSFTGNGNQTTFFSTGPKMLVVFNSSDDKKFAGEGFRLSYQMSTANPIFLPNKTQMIEDSTAFIIVFFTSAFLPTSVVWRKDGDLVYEDTNFNHEQTEDGYDPGQLHKSTLIVRSLTDSSYASYKVSVANRVGFSESYAELVRPSSVPIFGSFKSTIDQNILSLQVLFDASDQFFTVLWYKNETQLNDTSKYATSVAKSSSPTNQYLSVLRISSLVADDFTMYRMSVETKAGKASLNVPVHFTKRYLPDIRFYNITMEKDAVISLTYYSNPPVKSVAWYRADNLLQNDTKYSVTSRSLKIKNVTEADFGLYRAFITNAAGTVSRNIEILKPTVFPAYITCNQSTGAVLSCTVQSCKPFKFLSWIHSIKGREVRRLKGVTNDNTNTLTIPFCFIENLGHYTCVTEEEDDEGVKREIRQNSVFIDPQAPPLIGPNVQYNETYDGLTITLDVYSSLPMSFLKWYLFERDSRSVIKGISHKESDVVVSIRNLNVTLAGLRVTTLHRYPIYDVYVEYELEVGNDAGISNYIWTLKNPKADVPVIYGDVKQESFNNNLIISQKFGSDPGHEVIEWRDARTGTLLNDSTKYDFFTSPDWRSSSFLATLTIANVSAEDYKVYKLTVRNKIGFAESFVRLTNPNEGIPVFRNYSRNVSGKIVSITVNYTANPPSQGALWYRSGMVLEINNPNFQVTTMEIQIMLNDGDVVSGYKTVLTNMDARDTDNQLYKVRLSNQLGYTDVYVNPDHGCPGMSR